MVVYVDAHSHAHEYPDEELEKILDSLDIYIVVVSDDYRSSIRTVQLASRFKRLVPCVGVHPWTVNELDREKALEEARRTIELALNKGIKCLGEIGLDTKFVGESIELQREVFRLFLEASREHGLRLNLHTAGTWEETLRLLQRYDIGYANFHWYTGPPQLLREIVDAGYTISINPAVRIQKKHQEIVRQAPLEIMLTESDAPYEYRGIKMSPLLVPEVVEKIAEIKGLEPVDVAGSIARLFKKKWLT
jgi:TatD DNase family protein